MSLFPAASVPAPDHIFIRQLAVDAIIGVHPFERQHEQRLYLDLDLMLDLQAAGHSDQLPDTLDYQAIQTLLIHTTRQLQAQLLEHLAARLIAVLFAHDDRLQAVRLSIHKPDALQGIGSVGVQLVRQRPA